MGGGEGLASCMAYISNNTKLLMFYLSVSTHLSPGGLAQLFKSESIPFFLEFVF